MAYSAELYVHDLDRQAADLNQFLLPPVCEQFGIDMPELYYVKDKMANTATFGSTYPFSSM